ncbi:Coa6p ASCRUDRAFT_134690 [Ascoidea rubescens DSM 1968]|uniref:Cytochrome c oxidase assembly factor 6 n=1 Tax=Ascoidea rubescens DSM 1968 TaxID=1344418 RepID=A0A1D2VLI8_9ASCO|nr:hypothetical protein ASCRUDRAFT_134690 [Ascoidea rubescens DSM 1968]ODV62407.1 hypothetical protein ASCRUDRAFT_134690 [Ascoidea rubescens DSM 1968]
MGILAWSSKPEENKDSLPLRSNRKICWESRDGFNKCLDKIEVINPLDPANKKIIEKNCSAEDKRFQQDCATSWVKYFKEKRIVDIKKAKIQKEIDENRATQLPFTIG